MKRDIWTDTLSEVSCPPWPCPHCYKSTLRLVLKSIRSEETVESKAAHNEEGWDPDWVNEVFSGWLKCADAKCGQTVAVSGYGSPQAFFEEEEGMSWENRYIPRIALPMPDMFDLPAKCPEQVTQEVRAAFRLFWSDQASAANRLRAALERLLDHVGVKTRGKDKHNRLVILTLHARIQEFAKGESVLGGHLLALKWLGNTGSHGTGVTASDLLDAFEVFEHCLAEIVTQRSKKIAALSKQLEKKHAPKKRTVKKKATKKTLVPAAAVGGPPTANS